MNGRTRKLLLSFAAATTDGSPRAVNQIFRAFKAKNSKDKGRARKQMEKVLRLKPATVLQPSVLLRRK